MSFDIESTLSELWEVAPPQADLIQCVHWVNITKKYNHFPKCPASSADFNTHKHTHTSYHSDSAFRSQWY